MMDQTINKSKESVHSSAWVLTIDQFKEMDRQAIEQFHLPIEIMMENAGLQLARLITTLEPGLKEVIIHQHFAAQSIAQSINNAGH